MTSSAVSARELFVAAAHQHLRVGRRSLSAPQSWDLAAQVSAVDLGLKPALLYDSNGAGAEQVQQYLSSLQSSWCVSKSLLTLDLSGNALIVNAVTARSHLEQVLHDNSLAVIDVCHSLDRPAITGLLSGELRSMIQHLLLLLRGFEQSKEAAKPLYVGEECAGWNLCTVFGLLLGYPVTYWFDQTKSFENCLSMTPLVVTTAKATWQADTTCCLYSFSVPAALLEETQSILEDWRLRLRERFQQQNVLKDIAVCQTTVTLPSVCL